MQMDNQELCIRSGLRTSLTCCVYTNHSCSNGWQPWRSDALRCRERTIPLRPPSTTTHTNLSKHHMYHCLQMRKWACETKGIVWESGCKVKMCVCVHVSVHASVHVQLHNQEHQTAHFSDYIRDLFRLDSFAVFSSVSGPEDDNKEKKQRKRVRTRPVILPGKNPEGFWALKNKANLKVI